MILLLDPTNYLTTDIIKDAKGNIPFGGMPTYKNVFPNDAVKEVDDSPSIESGVLSHTFPSPWVQRWMTQRAGRKDKTTQMQYSNKRTTARKSMAHF